MSEIWLKYTTGSYVPPVGVFIGVFAAVSFITWSAQVGEIVQIMIRVGVKSAIHLHQVLVTATFNAPMSYFESTDTSILINKFSQDMSLIEMDLPISVWQLLNGKHTPASRILLMKSSLCKSHCELWATQQWLELHGIDGSFCAVHPLLDPILLSPDVEAIATAGSRSQKPHVSALH